MGSCFKTSNNKYFDCPALMEDGRAFTDYRPSSYVNDLLRIQNRVYDSYSYRQFMIHNGLNIIETNDKYNDLKNGCASLLIKIFQMNQLASTTNISACVCLMVVMV